MRILAIGDFHGKFPSKLKNEARKADLILSTGDFGGSERMLKIIFKYFKKRWWKVVGREKAKELVLEDWSKGKSVIAQLDKLKKPVYSVYGNWDFTSLAKWERTAGINVKKYSELMKNIHLFNRTLKKIKGINILFFGGMVTAGAYTEGFFDEKKTRKYKKENKKETSQIMKYNKKRVDILFAHYPPFGFFDIVKYKGENPMKGKHIGFKGYTKFIKKNQPKLFICGHMHEYQGIKKLGKTLIIATGAARDGKAAIIEIEKERIKSIKFIK